MNDGGPAYPCTALQPLDGGTYSRSETGMSLRDYFAGQALAGLCNGAHGYSEERTAKEAYAVADAMLEARKEQP